MNVKLFVTILVIVVLISFLSLLKPSPLVDGACWWNEQYSIGKLLLNYSVNCDSAEFVRLLITFPRGYLLNPTRMNRPLYTAMTVPVYKLTKPWLLFPQIIKQRVDNKMGDVVMEEFWQGIEAEDVIAAWISSIMVNWMLAALAIYFLIQACIKAEMGKISFALPFVVLLSERFRDFVLLPHTMMFDFLIPGFIFYLAMRELNRKGVSQKGRVSIIEALFLGVMFLGKGLLFTGLVFLWLLWVKKDQGCWRKVFALILPWLVYLGILQILGITFYNHELEVNREGVWLFDSLAGFGAGMTFKLIVSQVVLLFTFIIMTLKNEIVILTVLLIFLRFSWHKLLKSADKKFIGAYFICWMIFFIWVGYVESQISYTLFPIVLLVLGRLVSSFPEWVRGWVLLGVLFIQAVIVYG